MFTIAALTIRPSVIALSADVESVTSIINKQLIVYDLISSRPLLPEKRLSCEKLDKNVNNRNRLEISIVESGLVFRIFATIKTDNHSH